MNRTDSLMVYYNSHIPIMFSQVSGGELISLRLLGNNIILQIKLHKRNSENFALDGAIPPALTTTASVNGSARMRDSVIYFSSCWGIIFPQTMSVFIYIIETIATQPRTNLKKPAQQKAWLKYWQSEISNRINDWHPMFTNERFALWALTNPY